MDPVTIIIGALGSAILAGAADAAKDIAVEEMPKAYQALKTLVISKLQSGAKVDAAYAKLLVKDLEQNPKSAESQDNLKAKLQEASINEKDEVVSQAEALDKLVKEKTRTVDGAKVLIDSTAMLKESKTTVGGVKVSGQVDEVRGANVIIKGTMDKAELNVGGTEVNMDDEAK